MADETGWELKSPPEINGMESLLEEATLALIYFAARSM